MYQAVSVCTNSRTQHQLKKAFVMDVGLSFGGDMSVRVFVVQT